MLRGHWTFENRLHYLRDETSYEDRSQVHTGAAAHALAAWRDAMIGLLRFHGCTILQPPPGAAPSNRNACCISSAQRHHETTMREALTRVGTRSGLHRMVELTLYAAPVVTGLSE